MSQGDHSETLLLLAPFYQSTPSCLKVMGGVVAGPCDFSVSPSPFGLDFGTLDFGLGLDNSSLFQTHSRRRHSHPVWNFLCELRTLQLIFAKFVSVNWRKITKYLNNHYCSGLAEQNQKTITADKWSVNDEDALSIFCVTLSYCWSSWLWESDSSSISENINSSPPLDLDIENLSRLL